MYTVLWWVPAGHRPTVAQAEERLNLIRAHGPSPHAFTFRERSPPPGSDEALQAREDDYCLA